ncbi:MAG: DedA family protein [Anaerocolumna sp.]|jgi:membrane protein DedA with SNARE-associated domain|nr:DedA family protein [Anaerocolumna sp.]
MDIQAITGYFQAYGIIAIFIIVFLEYLNLPGFPAGIILPLAGIFAKQGNISFLQAFLLSVLAGLFGSLLLYFLGRLGGEIFLDKYLLKFPKHRPAIEKTMKYISEKGCLGIFLAKQIPMIRTIISIPAGVLKFQIMKYTIYSTLGIALWNLVFMGAGYYLGDVVFKMF